jgi:hypothetical protein
MSGPGEATSRPRRLLRFGTGSAWSDHQLALAALGSGGAFVYLVALHRASGGFDPVFWLLAVAPAFLLRLNGSGAPLAFWALMLFGWFHLTPAGSFSWWALLGAAGVLLGHASAALSAVGPPGVHFPAQTVRRWFRLGLVALGAAAAVGLGAGLLHGRVDALGAVAQVLALAGLAGGVWLLRSNPPEPSD